jgi:uncharacterized membrane protein YgdD (TMEM256/DUF423 family)
MTLQPRSLRTAGALLLALGTLIGAFGAHALKARLAPDRYEVLQTAVHYQFIHALGLLLLGIAAERTPTPERALRIAGVLLLAGVLLFSGSLYLLLAGLPRSFGVITPVGGLCLILGWLTAAWAFARG